MDELAMKLILIAVVAVVVIGLIYAVFGRRRRKKAPPRELTYAQDYVQGSAADPARDVFAAARGGEPPTEDQIARARAGGLRGAPQLGQAPLPRQAREQLPGGIDDGHVA
jgi:hypothetical protein